MVLITIGANGRRLYRGPLTWARLLQSRRPAERPTGGPGSRPGPRQERNAAHAPRRRPPPAPPPPAGHRRRPPRGAEQYADQLTDLFEVMLGTGMRRGEVLALHWSDVHLMDRKLFVRWTLAAIDNGQLTLGRPKTPASRAWISLSPRVTAALHRQAALQMNAHPDGRLEGLVFSTPGGAPLRPQWVLDQLRNRTTEVGLPAIGLHDLRHTAASIMIAEGIPLDIVSKTLRHATLATTINLYGHLFKDSADQAVHALARALDRAQAGRTQPHLSKDDGGENPMPVAA